MDKAKLFLMAAAPAALIVPMEVQAAEASIVKIIGNNIEGAEITAETSLIPKDKEIDSYQWFSVEGENQTPINVVGNKISIPAGLADKAIIVKVTTKDGTEYLSDKMFVHATLQATGEKYVNGKVYPEINTLNPKPVMKSYQWYFFDNGKKTPIKAATNIELTVPVEAAGKQLVVEAKSEEGKNYTSNPISIDALQLKLDPDPSITPLKIKGYSPEKFVLPGDTLSVVTPTVKDDTRDLKADQVSYAYQWMHKMGDSYSFISGATGATYKIPADALENQINKIVVRVIVTVGTTEAGPSYSEVVEVANNPAEGLVKSIDDLLGNSNKAIVYKSLGFEQFGNELTSLTSKYTALTAAAKANVTNYDILKRAIEDYKVVKSIKNQILEAQKLVDGTAKIQKFKALDAEYGKLDLLQRSIDTSIYPDIQTGLGSASQNTDIAEVIEINKSILGLLDLSTAGSSYALVTYKDSLSNLQENIKKIEDRIAKLSSEYKSTVQNLDILNTAKADIKKVQAFLDKANKIDVNTTAKKQVAAAKSIHTAYEKLNVKQQSLVPSSLFDMGSNLAIAETAEEKDVIYVQSVIDKYITLGPITEYKGIDSIDDIKEINKALTMYKTLTKDNAKKVTGYTELLQLQKDIKAADNVTAQIEKYKQLFDTVGVNDSKLTSTYNSTLNALNKLTTLQKSLVKNSDKLISPSPSEQPPGDKPLPEAEVKAKELGTAFVAKINLVISVPNSSFAIYAQDIEKLVNEYKSGLTSAARKYVTNYNELKAAEKDVKAVQSFIKKAETAAMEADLKKRYAKIQSVQKAYLSLSANQQKLAGTDKTYEKLIESLADKAIYTDLTELDQEIAMLADGNAGIEDIKKLEGKYKNLSAAEQKKIINYSILKQAMADVKKVEAFITQYNKMQENPAKNIQNVIKAFNALTVQQANLVPSQMRDNIIQQEKQQRESNDVALDLVSKIDNLVSSGEYITNLKGEVGQLRSEYEALSTVQKSLVKNYSKLTKAENDLAKVAEVRALEEAILNADDKQVARKAWQNAFNKLSNQLEKLYLIEYPTRIE